MKYRVFQTVEALRTPLAAQLITVFVAGVAVVGIGLIALRMMSASSHSAVDNSRAALLATHISDTTSQVRLIMEREETAGPVVIRARGLIDAFELLHGAEGDALELHRIVGSADTLEAYGTAADARAALLAWSESGSSLDRVVFEDRLEALQDVSLRVVPLLTAHATAEQDDLGRISRAAVVAIIVAMTLGGILVGGTSLAIARRLSEALRRAHKENGALVEATVRMKRRNDQFTALYQVMSEVSETLSMKYVVLTTLREARRLVHAEAVILRLLRNGRLEVVGTEAAPGMMIDALRPLELGQGVVGRAARRGKAIRVDSESAATMIPGEGIPQVQSGLIVPLIVGARVVGTLACWSRTPNLFGEDDEQVLTLMASQVATAVAAADTHEATRHEASHDPLTGLPNRRQMDADTLDVFSPRLATGARMAVAMVDVDHFKRFNDEFGHRVGDITLERVADVLRTALRDSDRVYRYGGEEFAVVLQDVGEPEAMRLLDRVRAAVEQAALVGESLEPIGNVTISVGVAHAPDDGGSFSELLQHADIALYHAKRNGRNRVSAYAGTGDEALPDAA